MSETTILGVQFTPVGKIYHFLAPSDTPAREGSFVVVRTSRGQQVGQVKGVGVKSAIQSDALQPIERVATDEDLAFKEALGQKEDEALEKVLAYFRRAKLDNVKPINTEYGFDSNRITFYLNYENDSGFDIKAFLREMSREFPNFRLEVKQVGPRDMAKAISGFGACGIEKRCCSRFLTEFSSISIKMAKSQDISLTPGEITGICGRLRCCLNYEHEQYEEARKNLPKRKKVVQTPMGEGRVVQVLPLSDSVVVELPEVGSKQFTRTELETGVMAEKPVARTFTEEYDKSDVELVSLETARPPQPAGREPGARDSRRNRRDQRGSNRGDAPQTQKDARSGRPDRQASSSNRRPDQRRQNRPNQPDGRGAAPKTNESTQSGGSRSQSRRKPRNQSNRRPQRPNTSQKGETTNSKEG